MICFLTGLFGAHIGKKTDLFKELALLVGNREVTFWPRSWQGSRKKEGLLGKKEEEGSRQQVETISH